MKTLKVIVYLETQCVSLSLSIYIYIYTKKGKENYGLTTT